MVYEISRWKLGGGGYLDENLNVGGEKGGICNGSN